MPKDQTPEAQKALMAAFQADRAKHVISVFHTPSTRRWLDLASRPKFTHRRPRRFDAEAKAEGYTSAEARGVDLRQKQAAQKAKEAEAAAAAAATLRGAVIMPRGFCSS